MLGKILHHPWEFLLAVLLYQINTELAKLVMERCWLGRLRDRFRQQHHHANKSNGKKQIAHDIIKVILELIMIIIVWLAKSQKVGYIDLVNPNNGLASSNTPSQDHVQL